MLFNSLEFAIFLPIVFFLYWLVLNKNRKAQNLFLLISSYVFYGWWDYRFLSLIIVSSIVDYLIGLNVYKHNTPIKRKLLLLISIIVNIGLLGFFKYYNFFVDSFASAFTFLGKSIETRTLNIILPVGISFYTFQTLSYSIDIYRRKLKPTKDIIAFFTFVSFFPQLVAGPIERASNLLPQFNKNRSFEIDKAEDGLRQILWGLFKKIVIADNCAIYVNDIFQNYSDYSGSTLLLGGVLFAFQIYGDFSGYSDIAIGTGRLLGFNLKRNFAFPYFSRDIAEFWRRWHISLATWFRDYVYIPLGGSRGGNWLKLRNTFVIFLVSGFWHGANWTFIIWGLINALYILPLMLLNKNRANKDIVAKGKLIPSIKEILQIGVTFFITVIAWIFFRAENLNHAYHYLGNILNISLFQIPNILPKKTLFLIALVMVVEWIQREKEHALYLSFKKYGFIKKLIYYTIIILIIKFGASQESFIYFQF